MQPFILILPLSGVLKNVEVLYIIQYASRYCKLRAFFIN